jgi:hypothetical protein
MIAQAARRSAALTASVLRIWMQDAAKAELSCSLDFHSSQRLNPHL